MQTHSIVISSIGTSVPKHRFAQLELVNFMANALSMDEVQKRKLNALYKATGISFRHSVISDYNKEIVDFTFYPPNKNLYPFPTVAERMKVYREEAPILAVEAIKKCCANLANFSLQQITHLVTVSCTGMYAPGIDIDLIKLLDLPSNIQRTAVNFMGCYGAFNGLKIADAICRAYPHAKVLVVCVELCTLHFQQNTNEDNLLSGAIFSDGAAAAIVENNSETDGLVIEKFLCDLIPSAAHDMAWMIANHGFEMILSSYIPQIIHQNIASFIDKLTSNYLPSPTLFAIHPGGKKILQAIEKTTMIDEYNNRYSYQILNEFGNMSSATVLFVLEKVWLENRHCKEATVLSMAFGPGLTMESMLLKIQ